MIQLLVVATIVVAQDRQPLLLDQLGAKPCPNRLGLILDEVDVTWRCEAQASARLLVASDQDRLRLDIGDVWDSGRRYGDHQQATFVVPSTMDALQTVWWKVFVWDESGEAVTSEDQRFDFPDDPSLPSLLRMTHAGEGELEFIAGRHGQAIRMTEASPPVWADDHADLRSDRTTISAWVLPEALGSDWQCIYRKEDSRHRRLVALGEEGPFWGVWTGLWLADDYHEVGARVDPAELSDGRWHQHCGHRRRTASANLCRRPSAGRGGAAGPLGSGAQERAYVGSYDGGDERFVGGIDDLRVYTEALTEDEIVALADGTTEVRNEDLGGRWAFDGTVSNSVRGHQLTRNRIVLVGGSLIASMDKHGFFETALMTRWPTRLVTVRNIGWPGDDVLGTARSGFDSNTRRPSGQSPPGAGFTVLMEHLQRARPTTVIVGYGEEAAFHRDEEDLRRFVHHYTKFVDTLLELGCHLVLLAPLPHQSFGEVLPDPTSANDRLGQATEELAAIASERGLLLIRAPQDLTDRGGEAMTTNGIALSKAGHQVLARHLVKELNLDRCAVSFSLSDDLRLQSADGGSVDLLGETVRGVELAVQPDHLSVPAITSPSHISLPMGGYHVKVDAGEPLEISDGGGAVPSLWHTGPNVLRVAQLRDVIREKNQLYRRRLRPMNETYVFLFRSYEMGHLAYEMEDFEDLVREKERAIDRLRQPEQVTYRVDRISAWKAPREYPDHEVPRAIPDPDIAAEMAAMTLAEGLEVQLYASDPMVANPINLNWDERGRAWVSMSSTYPHIVPGREPNDRIVILEDLDEDGSADRCIEFADGLLVPHSVMPVEGGAYVCSSTELLFLADNDGDDRADERRVVFSGFGNADVHHMIHGFTWAPWGELYFLQSIYIHSFIQTAWGNRRLNGSGVWRLRPETERLEVFSRGLVNPWGFTFDRWGQSFATDGAGGQGPHYMFPGSEFQTAVGASRILRGMVAGNPKATAAELVSGRHLPEAWQGSLLANDFRANRTMRFELTENASGYQAKEVETVIHSNHRSFRPVDLKIGPDGALYVVDWYNPIIDHGEVDFHHPLRDKQHGRIWRLTVKDRPLVERPELLGSSIEQLCDLLFAPEAWSRTQARRELARRDAEQVRQGVHAWCAGFDLEAPTRPTAVLETLWVLANHQLVDASLLREAMLGPNPRVRAAAVRLASLQIDRHSGAVEWFAQAINDDHPQVRLEAVNALREVGSLDAANAALAVLEWPMDENLDFAAWLTARELREVWLPSLQRGDPVFGGSSESLKFALEASGDERAMGPLLGYLEDDTIELEKRPGVVRTVASLGDGEALDRLLWLADRDPHLLTAIAEGASGNDARATRLDSVLAHLRGPDPTQNLAAAKLSGLWGVVEAVPTLVEMVRGDVPPLRGAAARALARLGEHAQLARLTEGDQPIATQIEAAAAWVAARGDDATAAAIAVLERADDSSDTRPLFLSFFRRDQGPVRLRDGLDGRELHPAVATTGIREARASALDVEEVVAALATAGSLEPISSDLTQSERASLLADVERHGDATRGAKIYARDSLACTTCHRIRGEGGQVGPDLSTIGSFRTPESILESLLQPSVTIQQGFGTTLVFLDDGSVHSGILQRRTEEALLLRDASGEVLSIPLDSIDEQRASEISLMPRDLTTGLLREELLDLMRYLTELR